MVPKPLRQAWDPSKLHLRDLALVISSSSLSLQVDRNPLGGLGSLPNSIFEVLARVLSAGHFLFELVFKHVSKLIWRARSGPFQTPFSTPELIWRAWVPSKLRFRVLARVIGAGHFLFKFVFKSVPKLI